MNPVKSMKRWLAPVLAAVLLGVLVPPTAQAAPTEAPTLLAPGSGLSVGANPTLNWTRVSGAPRYRVQISTSPAFSSFVYNADTYNSSATPPTELPIGILYWRVAALDTAGAPGPFAESIFTKTSRSAPVITAPAEGTTLGFPSEPPLFAWEPAAGAKKYRLEIDDAEDFIGATTYETGNLYFSLTEPQTVGQSFFWRVQGFNGSVNTEWSPIRSYSIAWPTVPVPLSPAEGSTVQDVAFEWEPVPGASTYQLQVSPNGDWANNITVDATVKSTRYSRPATLNNGSYFWRVRARDAKTTPNLGGWSTVRQFTRGWPTRPTPTTPTNGDTNVTTPTFSWTPVAHASYYEIQISTDSSFSPGTITSCYTNHTSFTPHDLTASNPAAVQPGTCGTNSDGLESLAAGQTYYWRVRGQDNHTSGAVVVNGLFSEEFSFVYKPGVPAPLSPEDGVTTSVPVLEWAAVTGASKYRVTITKASGSVALTADTTNLSFVPTIELKATEGPFKWTVRSIETIDGTDRLGLVPPLSYQRSFQVEAPATTFPEPEVIAPAANESNIYMPSMTWQPMTGAAYYKVFYGVAGSGVEYELTGASTKLYFPAYTHTAFLQPADYFWYVRAYDLSNNLVGISPLDGSFRLANLAPTSYVAPARCLPTDPCEPQAETPTMRWNPVLGADYYLVTLAYDADFTNETKTYRTHFASLTPRESLLDNQAGQAYYWFVRPCKAGGLCGQFNSSVFPNAFAFRKRSAAIEQLSPADGSTMQNQVTFSWREYLATNQALTEPVTQGAKQYKIQVSKVADFSETPIDEAIVDQTSYTPSSLTYPEGPLYWRVQAIDGSGNPLTFSPTRLVTKSSPSVALTYPQHQAVVAGVPYLRWDSQTYASKYEVEVYKDADLNFSQGNRVLSQQTKMAVVAPTTSLAAGTYAWRVRRLDADSRPGPWSSGRTFGLVPGAPSLLAPADGVVKTNDDLLFQWGAVQGAAEYKFELSTSPSFAVLTENQNTVMTSWAPTRKLADGVYHWRVRTVDAGNNAGPAVESRSFVVDQNAPTTSLTVGPTGGVTSTTARFEFTSPESGATFECSLDGSGFQPCGSAKTYEGLAQGSHTFKVRAVDANGNFDATPEIRTWTVSSVQIQKIVYKASTLNGEWIQLRNKAATAVSLLNWKIKDASGITYKFGTYTLGGGKYVKVHTGKGTNTTTDRYWGRTAQVWGNTGDTAKVFRSNGTLADTCSFVASSLNYILC